MGGMDMTSAKSPKPSYEERKTSVSLWRLPRVHDHGFRLLRRQRDFGAVTQPVSSYSLF